MTKTIAYGFEVPVNYNWVAVDDDGDVYAFVDKPELNHSDGTWYGEAGTHKLLGTIRGGIDHTTSRLHIIHLPTKQETPMPLVTLGSTVTLKSSVNNKHSTFTLVGIGTHAVLISSRSQAFDSIGMKITHGHGGVALEALQEHVEHDGLWKLVNPKPEATYKAGSVFSINMYDNYQTYMLVQTSLSEHHLVSLGNGNRFHSTPLKAVSEVTHTELSDYLKRDFTYKGLFSDIYQEIT